MMKVLLSAYACEPNKGSEPGVGWNWAVEMSNAGHEVWVVTRANNRPAIEATPENQNENLHFEYYDLPKEVKRFKRGNWGIHLYYLLWQIGAFFVARKLIQQVQFDVVHHVTFVSVRQPSFMGFLGLPFIFGPVAGGESAPWLLRRSYPVRGWVRDMVRDLLNLLVRFDPLMWCTFAKASKIIVTSEQTKKLLPAVFQAKARTQLAIGVESSMTMQRVPVPLQTNGNFRILYVGQLLYLKGVHLGLDAFARFSKTVTDSSLTVIGDGPDAAWLHEKAARLGLGSSSTWIPRMSRDELLKIYGNYDLFLFPSLHDSGGMVVLEAMLNGLPVLCFDLGGPGVIVDDTCGFVVRTTDRTEDEVIDDLSTIMVKVASDPQLRHHMGISAIKRAERYFWSNVISQIHGAI